MTKAQKGIKGGEHHEGVFRVQHSGTNSLIFKGFQPSH